MIEFNRALDILARKRSVGIFRLDLFKRSETFIEKQVGAYRGYMPIYCGLDSKNPKTKSEKAVMLAPGVLAKALFVLGGRARSLVSKLEARKIDILHAHFAIDGSLAMNVARALKVPIVVTLHGFDVAATDKHLLQSKQPTLLMFLLRRRRLFKHVDKFVCVSEYIKRLAIARGYPADKLVVLPIGINVDGIVPFQGDSHTVVHVGRLVEKKGTEYLLKAASVVKDEIPQLRITIVGDGPLRNGLEDLAQELRIRDIVRFVGEQDHMATLNYIANAAVVCVPSVTAENGDSEGLPTVIYEAMARGVPVVASETSGIPELVIDGRTGLLAPERDSAALGSALRKLILDDALRVTLGKAGRALVAEHYDIRSQTAQLEALYDELLSS